MIDSEGSALPSTRRLGQKIREARKAAELSLEELAALTGLVPEELYRIEVGQRRPEPSLLIGIAEQLKSPISALFADMHVTTDEGLVMQRASFDEPTDPLLTLLETKGALELLGLYVELPTKLRQQAIGVVRSLLQQAPR